MTKTLKNIIKGVNNYYSSKIKRHGAIPAGVDWKSYESQSLRFEQLLKVIDTDQAFNLLDYGCGYGALYEYMVNRYEDFNYTGYDISEEMINAAVKNYNSRNTKWISTVSSVYDYVVASGLFNVRLSHSDKEWYNYLITVLTELNEISKKGFSFNVLTKYSDLVKMQDYLYYADPLILFDYCKRNFSRKVVLLHDYPLYEFTLIIRK